MNPETLASLQSLEQELDRLRSAIDHIEQAKSVAQKVVGAVAGVQKKYGEHLDALLAMQQQGLEQLHSASTMHFEEWNAGAKRHILESAARARKQLEEHDADARRAIAEAGEAAARTLQELTYRAEQLLDSAERSMARAVEDSSNAAGQQVRNLGTQVKSLLEELTARTSRLMDEAGGGVSRKIEDIASQVHRNIEEQTTSAHSHIVDLAARAHRHVEDFGTKAGSQIEQLGQLAASNYRDAVSESRKALDEASQQSIRIFASIKKTYDQQAMDFEKLSVSTDAVIASSAKLVRTIDAIDFPEKLQTIQSDIRSLHFNLNGAMSRIDALDKSVEASLRALADDMVAKLGRLEMFTERTVRNLNDENERRFRDQVGDIQRTRTLVTVLLVLQLLTLIGLFLVWNKDADEPAQPVQQRIEQAPPDTTPAPVEEPKKKRNR